MKKAFSVPEIRWGSQGRFSAGGCQPECSAVGDVVTNSNTTSDGAVGDVVTNSNTTSIRPLMGTPEGYNY